MKIEITDTNVNVRNFEKDGKTFTFREQLAWFHSDSKYPVAFKLSLGDAQAYPVGVYTIDSSSLFVDRYQNLAFKRVLVLSKA